MNLQVSISIVGRYLRNQKNKQQKKNTREKKKKRKKRVREKEGKRRKGKAQIKGKEKKRKDKRYSARQLVRLSEEPENSSLHTKSHPGRAWEETRQIKKRNNETTTAGCIM